MDEAPPRELIGFQAELLLRKLANAFAIARSPAVTRVLCLIIVLVIIIIVSAEATHYFGDKISRFEFLCL